ncbi:MAG: UbiA-like polyprenyltransferase [Thermoanaerobaculia bacterium]
MPNGTVPAASSISVAPLRATLQMIKFSHTLFALPFALLAAFLAARGVPRWETLVFILLAMVGARSAAMSFNRIADRDVDALNPRTASREIPSGAVSVGWASLFCLLSGALFVFSASRLNRLCLLLSPVALALVLGYSLTKRFTSLSHLVLGLSLAIAPVGAWLAVRGSFALLPVLLGLAVLFWVAGFDIIYSLQDEAFDREHGLRSLPARLGARRALRVSRLFHAVTFALLLAVAFRAHGGPIFFAGVIAAGIFLVRQHTLVSPTDLSRVDAAFFTANGWLSVIVLVAGVVDLFVPLR